MEKCDHYVVVITKKGFMIKIDAETLRTQQRYGQGVPAIKLKEGDEVVGITDLHVEKPELKPDPNAF